MKEFTYTVTIEAETASQAEQVMSERLGHDDDYGFDYTLEWTRATDNVEAYKRLRETVRSFEYLCQDQKEYDWRKELKTVMLKARGTMSSVMALEQSGKPQRIIIQVKGGLVEDVSGIPSGILVEVQDFDAAEDPDVEAIWYSMPEKERPGDAPCYVSIYNCDGVVLQPAPEAKAVPTMAGVDAEPNRYINHYRHDDCPKEPGIEWQDESPSMNNDRCPECNAEIEPYESKDAEPRPSGKFVVIRQDTKYSDPMVIDMDSEQHAAFNSVEELADQIETQGWNWTPDAPDTEYDIQPFDPEKHGGLV